MRFFLIGYMGCGKSRWGKLIANHYNYKFIDLDTLIEEREGLTIPEIFAKCNEEGFREKERQALLAVKDYNNVIIATGGGAPCFYDNISKMNNLGETIYIKVSPELLCERLLNSKTERPLVKGLSKFELLQYIENHLELRKAYYEQAKYQIVSGELKLEDFIKLVDSIIKYQGQNN